MDSQGLQEEHGNVNDEMLGTLKNVGSNLKSPTFWRTSVDTLKQLAGYYEHQQEQLKGFEKNPKKLQENLAIIDGWIRDIRLLIKTLSG